MQSRAPAPDRDALDAEMDALVEAGEEKHRHDHIHVSPVEAAARAAVRKAASEMGEDAILEHFERRSDGDHITFHFPRATCGHPLRFAGVRVRVLRVEEDGP